jgi:hypothetical protein
MTYLETLVRQHVAGSVTATLSRTAERIAESLAEEILRDPQFRADMRALVARAFRQTLGELAADTPAPPPAGEAAP